MAVCFRGRNTVRSPSLPCPPIVLRRCAYGLCATPATSSSGCPFRRPTECRRDVLRRMTLSAVKVSAVLSAVGVAKWPRRRGHPRSPL